MAIVRTPMWLRQRSGKLELALEIFRCVFRITTLFMNLYHQQKTEYKLILMELQCSYIEKTMHFFRLHSPVCDTSDV